MLNAATHAARLARRPFMNRALRPLVFTFLVAAGSVGFLASQPPPAGVVEAPVWAVVDVRAGMKGIGKTCVKGTKVETFDVEIIGVLKNTSPGRDMILARLSGLNLDKTGVIQGMSGSPIYIQ